MPPVSKPARKAGPAGKSKSTAHDRIYQVCWSESRDRFEVHDDGGQIHGFSRDKHAAIEAAMREAGMAHGRGESAIVCVEQDDGHFTIACAYP